MIDVIIVEAPVHPNGRLYEYRANSYLLGYIKSQWNMALWHGYKFKVVTVKDDVDYRHFDTYEEADVAIRELLRDDYLIKVLDEYHALLERNFDIKEDGGVHYISRSLRRSSPVETLNSEKGAGRKLRKCLQGLDFLLNQGHSGVEQKIYSPQEFNPVPHRACGG